MKFQPTSYMKCAIIYADKAIAETSQQTTSRHVESSRDGIQASEASESSKLVLRVNDEGRYVCQLCEKTFKTVRCFTRNNKHVYVELYFFGQKSAKCKNRLSNIS